MGRLGKAKWYLLVCLIVLIVLVAGAVFVPGSLIKVVKWVADSDFAHGLRGLVGQEADHEDTLVEMVVERVGCSRTELQPVIILREKQGELYLPIWVGALEANAILVVIEGVEVPRPLTADLLCSILARMGASVDYIVIDDLRDQIFYAKIIINADWRQMKIDARPSDAIAVALRVGAPIFVAEAVLDEAGVQPERGAGEYTIMHIESRRLG